MSPPPHGPRTHSRPGGAAATWGVARGWHRDRTPLWFPLRGPRFPRSAGASEPSRSHVPHNLKIRPHPSRAGGIAGSGRRSGCEQRLSPALLPALRRCLRARIPWAASRARRRGFPARYRAAAHLRGLTSCGFQVAPCAPLRAAPTVSVFPPSLFRLNVTASTALKVQQAQTESDRFGLHAFRRLSFLLLGTEAR